MTLYEKIIRAPDTIGWKDILSDARTKHSKRDMEYAMIAGTSLDSANEQNMLQKWQKPWLFFRCAIAGLILGALMIGLQMVLLNMYGMRDIGYSAFIAYILPMIVPLVLMVFFWEMNVPRNISVMELGVAFLIGAAICFFATFAMFAVVPDVVPSFERFGAGVTKKVYNELYNAGWDLRCASFAALREEPAKLLASVVILAYLSRKGTKIYGFTGLVVGAAVGAAFSAYESIQYGLNYGTGNVLYRAVLSIGGHVLYCAPYTAMLALASKNNKFSPRALLNGGFLRAFGFSMLMHAAWNFGRNEYIYYLSVNPMERGNFEVLFKGMLGKGDGGVPAMVIALIDGISTPKIIFVIVMLWICTLKVTRKCFAQVGSMVSVSTPNAAAFQIVGMSGFFANKQFSIKSAEILIGCDNDARLCYPVGTPNIAQKHCKLLIRNGYLYLGDLNTQSGTYINGKRIESGKGHLLQSGDTFWIGSQQEAFKLL